METNQYMLNALYYAVIDQLCQSDDVFDAEAVLSITDAIELHIMHLDDNDPNPNAYRCCLFRCDSSTPFATMRIVPVGDLEMPDFLEIWKWAVKTIHVSDPVPVGIAFEEEGNIEVT